MIEMSNAFAVTKVLHPALHGFSGPCSDCLAQAEQAASMARATGSNGATHGDGEHEATVARMLGTVTL